MCGVGPRPRRSRSRFHAQHPLRRLRGAIPHAYAAIPLPYPACKDAPLRPCIALHGVSGPERTRPSMVWGPYAWFGVSRSIGLDDRLWPPMAAYGRLWPP